MILSGKRLASSPAEAEKKKPDCKTSSTTECPGSYRDAASRGYQPPNSVTVDWDEDNDDGNPWQPSSPHHGRRRKWSTGKSPGGTPPQPPSQPIHWQRSRNEMAGPNPNFLHKHTIPFFTMKNEGAFREELEVEIQTINDQPFRGSITRQEAKHRIYREALGCPFSNFRGARTGYKACPTATFMLKKAINIDDLASFQNFSFERRYTKADGTPVIDVLKGKLKGVRTITGGDETPSFSDEWTRIVKIEGCDYRVSGETILEWLGHYGEILSDLVEDVFEDSEDSEGDNATGIYSVKMKLYSNIPQLLPVDGRRIKIYYRNINKLCTSCFGQHNRRDCKGVKVRWIDYVDKFINANPQINPALYGKWLMILEREKKQQQIDNLHFVSKQPNPDNQTEVIQAVSNQTTQDDTPSQAKDNEKTNANESQPIQILEKPKPEDFNLPSNPEEWKDVVEKMMALGLTNKEASASLEKRRKQFNNAMKEYSNNGTSASKKGRPKSRKNSINDF